MFPYRAAKACNNPISYNTYYLIFACIYSKSSRMPLKQEFASSSFYYGLSHEFFIAQASDPANTYAWVKQHLLVWAWVLWDWVLAAQQTPATCAVCVKVFSYLGIWGLRFTTVKINPVF